MTCSFGHDDAAYVLGALSPGERVLFERHLETCPDCSRSVRDLAGLPGLLARVPAEVLELPPTPEPVPATLLPNLVREVRRQRLRRTWVAAAVAAAALGAVTTGSLALTGAFDEQPAPVVTAPVATGVPMRRVGDPGMSAQIAMTSVPWGTRLDLTCAYEATRKWDEPKEGRYALMLRTRAGETLKVATWRPLPGKTMQLEAATAVGRDRIRSVEVRAPGGDVLLWLTT